MGWFEWRLKFYMTSPLLKESRHACDQEQLVQQLQQGDPSGFEFIVREYGGYLLNVARRYIANPDDAKDIVQETYLQAFSKIDKFRGDASIKSWLHRITINNALIKIRKDGKLTQITSTFDDDEFIDENGKRVENTKTISISADEMHMNRELRSAVKHSIMELPMTYRNIILLRDVEGYSIAETATLLDISPAAVKTGLHRARNKLKIQLENSGY